MHDAAERLQTLNQNMHFNISSLNSQAGFGKKIKHYQHFQVQHHSVCVCLSPALILTHSVFQVTTSNTVFGHKAGRLSKEFQGETVATPCGVVGWDAARFHLYLWSQSLLLVCLPVSAMVQKEPKSAGSMQDCNLPLYSKSMFHPLTSHLKVRSE